MKLKFNARLFLFTLIASVSAFAHAQDMALNGQKPHRLQGLELTYDYIHANGPPQACGCFSVNGGGVVYVHPLSSSGFDLVGKFGAARASGIGANKLDLTLVTYTAGVRYYPNRKSFNWRPYGEMQVGGAYDGGNLLSPPNPAGASTHSAFAGSAGAGLELALNPRFSLKLADVQYLVTTFANGSTDHQNNLRISAGLVVHFGKSSR